MKTIVINTSKEAKDTKLDVLFKAPFDGSSLLWIDSALTELGENAEIIKCNLLEDVDTVERDYQLIVLIDTYPLPCGNMKNAIVCYEMLLERYVLAELVEKLHGQLNLSPNGVSIYFVNSARKEQGLDLDSLAANPRQQEKQEQKTKKERQKKGRDMLKYEDGDLCDDSGPYEKKETVEELTPDQLLLMDVFGWTKDVTRDAFSWKMKISVSGDETIDFSEIFRDTSRAVRVSDDETNVLQLVLREVNVPREQWLLSCVGRFPIYSLECFISRENEQSKLEGFFCVFANIFTCVQEKTLLHQVTVYDKEQIRTLLVDALKKYKYFSAEENIKVAFEPITKVFEQREEIIKTRAKDIRARKEFKDKSEEAIAEQVMSEFKPPRYMLENRKLRGLDRQFYELAEEVFGNYDEDVIRAQNNRVVKSCLEGLWSWRDKQTREGFKVIVDNIVPNNMADDETAQMKRETIAFLREEYETKRDELINQVTDAENKLAANDNILLQTKDLMLRYGDWMRKGMWSWVSFIGAIFTIISTVFPFFYTEYVIGHTGLGFHVNLLAIVGLCAFLYSVAISIYISYISRKKLGLIYELSALVEKSKEERKASIIALWRYYNETILDAESYSLLWREILRRDRENAKKGIKRNYHIKRLKDLAKQVNEFITMLKLDVQDNVEADSEDEKLYARKGLRINGEESYYHRDNRRVYCLLPEKETTLPQKGDKGEA